MLENAIEKYGNNYGKWVEKIVEKITVNETLIVLEYYVGKITVKRENYSGKKNYGELGTVIRD